MKNILIIALAFLVISSCNNNNQKADAYGNFEATEITISSEINGKIIQFDIQIPQTALLGEGDSKTFLFRSILSQMGEVCKKDRFF